MLAHLGKISGQGVFCTGIGHDVRGGMRTEDKGLCMKCHVFRGMSTNRYAVLALAEYPRAPERLDIQIGFTIEEYG